jgi:circadian clock protein KaiC
LARESGAGKTAIALNFLLEVANLGERSLYVTLCEIMLSERESELREGAASDGWVLS